MTDTPLIQWLPPEPQFWESAENTGGYSENTNTTLAEDKKSLMEDLYWIKWKDRDNYVEANTGEDVDEKPERDNYVEIKEGEEVPKESIEDSPYSPVIDGLLKEWHIDKEQYDKTIEEMKGLPLEESEVILEKLINWLPNLDSKEKNKLINWFKETKEVTKENFEESEFYKDFTSTESLNESDPNDLDLMLAENYIKIPDNEWNEVKKEDNLEITMNVVLNKIINKHSKDFKSNNSVLINEIRNCENYVDKYVKLKSLLKESKLIDWRWGAKQAKEFSKKAKWVETQKQTLEERFNSLKEGIEKARKSKESKAIEQLMEEAIGLKEDIEASWDVFEAWDIDLLIQEIQEITKEAGS